MFLRIEIPQNTDVVFSPNSRYMAVSGEENLVRIWEVTTWVELPPLEHEHQVKSIAFSPDSQYFATTSFDKTAIWKAPNFQEVARVTYNEDIVSVIFSPDGKYLATANSNGVTTVQFWYPNDLITETCNRLLRNLTLEEWAQFFGNEPYCETCPNISGSQLP